MAYHNMTLRDIAKALKLSTSTVSKALRDSYEIGDKTKKRVINYAKKVGYQPNTIAKTLKEGKSRTIGVVICAIDNTFVSQILNGIDSACNDRGYNIMIMQSKESHAQEIKCVELLYGRSIDGLLISPACETSNVDHLKKYQNAGLPIVLFDRYIDGLELPKISINNVLAAHQATTHLIKNGYDKIALLHSNTRLNIDLQRLEGYKNALLDFHIPFRPEYIKACDLHNSNMLQKSISKAIESLMELADPPNALLAANDQISTQSIGIVKNLGYRIPQDLAFIGFTNTNLAASLDPPLSTIYQPAIEIGKAAANKLLDLIDGIDQEFDVFTDLEPLLIARASSAPLP